MVYNVHTYIHARTFIDEYTPHHTTLHQTHQRGAPSGPTNRFLLVVSFLAIFCTEYIFRPQFFLFFFALLVVGIPIHPPGRLRVKEAVGGGGRDGAC